MGKKAIYALYKGDKNIIDGTKEEIAKYLGISVKTVEYFRTPSYAKRGKDDYSNRKILVRIYGE